MDFPDPSIFLYQKTEQEYKACIALLEKVQQDYDRIFEKILELEG